MRCKPKVKRMEGVVLRICIQPLHGAFVLLAIMDIRAHPILRKALRGRLGHQFTVYSWGVIHNCPDTEKAFTEIARVVRKGRRSS